MQPILTKNIVFETGGTTEEERRSFVSMLNLYSGIGEHENIIKFYGVCEVGGE